MQHLKRNLVLCDKESSKEVAYGISKFNKIVMSNNKTVLNCSQVVFKLSILLTQFSNQQKKIVHPK